MTAIFLVVVVIIIMRFRFDGFSCQSDIWLNGTTLGRAPVFHLRFFLLAASSLVSLVTCYTFYFRSRQKEKRKGEVTWIFCYSLYVTSSVAQVSYWCHSHWIVQYLFIVRVSNKCNIALFVPFLLQCFRIEYSVANQRTIPTSTLRRDKRALNRCSLRLHQGRFFLSHAFAYSSDCSWCGDVTVVSHWFSEWSISVICDVGWFIADWSLSIE
jgi:hypothetical protein